MRDHDSGERGLVSLCMIVKDEARTLPRCLDSVRGVVSEIVLVDTGSTDDTPAIASARGARVHAFDFRDTDFSAARNFSLSRATGRFVLVLDADETLDAASAREIHAIARRGEHAGHIVTRRNVRDGALVVVDHAVRLFPRDPRYVYAGRVHETVDASLLAAGARLCESRIVLTHHLPSEALSRAKSERYIALLMRELADAPHDTGRLTFLAAEMHKLGKLDEATAITERIAELRPEDADAHVNAGLYHLMHKNDAARARVDFERALALRPDSRDAREGLRAIDDRARRSA